MDPKASQNTDFEHLHYFTFILFVYLFYVLTVITVKTSMAKKEVQSHIKSGNILFM